MVIPVLNTVCGNFKLNKELATTSHNFPYMKNTYKYSALSEMKYLSIELNYRYSGICFDLVTQIFCVLFQVAETEEEKQRRLKEWEDYLEKGKEDIQGSISQDNPGDSRIESDEDINTEESPPQESSDTSSMDQSGSESQAGSIQTGTQDSQAGDPGLTDPGGSLDIPEAAGASGE